MLPWAPLGVLGPGRCPNGSVAACCADWRCRNPKRSHLDPFQLIFDVFFAFIISDAYLGDLGDPEEDEDEEEDDN